VIRHRYTKQEFLALFKPSEGIPKELLIEEINPVLSAVPRQPVNFTTPSVEYEPSTRADPERRTVRPKKPEWGSSGNTFASSEGGGNGFGRGRRFERPPAVQTGEEETSSPLRRQRDLKRDLANWRSGKEPSDDSRGAFESGSRGSGGVPSWYSEDYSHATPSPSLSSLVGGSKDRKPDSKGEFWQSSSLKADVARSFSTEMSQPARTQQPERTKSDQELAKPEIKPFYETMGMGAPDGESLEPLEPSESKSDEKKEPSVLPPNDPRSNMPTFDTQGMGGYGGMAPPHPFDSPMGFPNVPMPDVPEQLRSLPKEEQLKWQYQARDHMIQMHMAEQHKRMMEQQQMFYRQQMGFNAGERDGSQPGQGPMPPFAGWGFGGFGGDVGGFFPPRPAQPTPEGVRAGQELLAAIQGRPSAAPGPAAGGNNANYPRTSEAGPSQPSQPRVGGYGGAGGHVDPWTVVAPPQGQPAEAKPQQARTAPQPAAASEPAPAAQSVNKAPSTAAPAGGVWGARMAKAKKEPAPKEPVAPKKAEPVEEAKKAPKIPLKETEQLSFWGETPLPASEAEVAAEKEDEGGFQVVGQKSQRGQKKLYKEEKTTADEDFDGVDLNQMVRSLDEDEEDARAVEATFVPERKVVKPKLASWGAKPSGAVTSSKKSISEIQREQAEEEMRKAKEEAERRREARLHEGHGMDRSNEDPWGATIKGFGRGAGGVGASSSLSLSDIQAQEAVEEARRAKRAEAEANARKAAEAMANSSFPTLGGSWTSSPPKSSAASLLDIQKEQEREERERAQRQSVEAAPSSSDFPSIGGPAPAPANVMAPSMGGQWARVARKQAVETPSFLDIQKEQLTREASSKATAASAQAKSVAAAVPLGSAWGRGSGVSKPVSLRDIEAEERTKAGHLASTPSKPQSSPAVASPPASQPAPGQHAVEAVPKSGIHLATEDEDDLLWGISSAHATPAKEEKFMSAKSTPTVASSGQKTLAKATPVSTRAAPAATSPSTAPAAVEAGVSRSSQSLFGGPEPSPELLRWGGQELMRLLGSDDTTMIHFLLSLNNAVDRKEYICEYIKHADAGRFADEFNRRAVFEGQWSEGTSAVSTTAAAKAVAATADADVSGAKKSKKKKKKGKGKQDNSLLGFVIA